MENKYLLSGYEFDESGPTLILDTILENSPVRSKFPIRGKSFTLRYYDESFCIGSYDLKTQSFNVCPNRAHPEPGKQLCIFCERQSGFNPAFYNTDYISDQQTIYNAKPHMVYLVNFGVLYTKIGIASKLPRRWLDQGARLGTIIKHCKDAYEAREIEAKTKSIIGIPEAINNSVKRRLLAYEYNRQRGEEEIDKTRDKIQQELEFQLEVNPIESLDKFYLSDNNLTMPIIDLTKENTFISGEMVGLVGDTLIMAQNNQQFMISLKKIISHLITIEDELVPNQSNFQSNFGF